MGGELLQLFPIQTVKICCIFSHGSRAVSIGKLHTLLSLPLASFLQQLKPFDPRPVLPVRPGWFPRELVLVVLQLQFIVSLLLPR